MVNSTYSKGNNEEGEAPWKMKGGGRIAALTKEGRRGGVSVKIRRGAAALMSPVWMKGHRECGGVIHSHLGRKKCLGAKR
jgi:hypothetical protein